MTLNIRQNFRSLLKVTMEQLLVFLWKNCLDLQ